MAGEVGTANAGTSSTDVPAYGSGDPAGTEGRSFQLRLEESGFGRAVISVVIVVVIIGVLVNNLPDSEVQRTVEPVFEPLLEGAALSQTWNLFAPTPRHISRELEVRFLYDDGTQLTWSPPEGDRIIGLYRDYRWDKWGREINLSNWRTHWPRTARWLAERHRRDGELPREVRLIRRFYLDPPTGSGVEEPPPWQEFEVFRARYGSVER